MQQKYITEKELSHRWNIGYRTLQRWRLDGSALPYYKIGRTIRYPLKVVEYFEAKGIRKPETNDKWGVIWKN